MSNILFTAGAKGGTANPQLPDSWLLTCGSMALTRYCLILMMKTGRSPGSFPKLSGLKSRKGLHTISWFIGPSMALPSFSPI